jgi:hypothetical protein
LISLNTIENNGLWKKDVAVGANQNTDGLKLKNSQNVSVTTNYIRENVRNNVLVEGNAPNTGAGVVITANHLDANVPQLNAGDAIGKGSIGGGLMLQITSPQAASTTVNADNNWWGHVYGPQAAANTVGRGSKIILNGGLVDADSWYGQRTPANQWYALNDQDGDGSWDAAEDQDLSGSETSALWGAETKLGVKDSDGDGYEDGAEIRLGTDPNNVAKTPANPAGDGSVAANPLASYANLTTGNTDSDGDRYLDFYEVAQGTSPTNAAEKPTLGLIQTAYLKTNPDTTTSWEDETEVTGRQVTKLRRLLIGSDSFTDTTQDSSGKYVVEQDNGDVTRDGVVNNADLIFLRRFVATTTPAFPVVLPAVTP